MNGIESMSVDEAEVRAVVERWASAVRRKELPEVLRDHSRGIVIFDVPPPFRSSGIDAYAKTWESFFAWAHEPVVYDITEMDVTAGSDVAFVVATMHCSGTEPDGEDIELDFRLTVGLRKIDGGWVVEHEHHSIPADPPNPAGSARTPRP